MNPSFTARRSVLLAGTIAGRLLGSVPANVSRRAKVDVLIVHTTP